MQAYYPQPALERPMKVQEVILRAIAKKILWCEAAEILGITDRQMRRIKRKYETHGYNGLYDRRRRCPSPKRVPLEVAEKVLTLYRDKYFDFNMSHFYDKLRNFHNINISYNWVRLALQGAGLIKKQPKRDTHRKRRPRKPLPGMMLHMDGSPHDWFKDPREYTIVTLYDDANNYLYDIEMVREEDSFTCMNMIKTLVEKKGIFCSLYTDRASHFFLTKKQGDRASKDSLTQIGRTLGELGIHHIPSYSPQARGRSERLNQTLQGRIPQELRLRSIKTIEEANRYLKKEYLKEHNRCFSIKLEEKRTAFIPVPKTVDLEKVFSFKHERTVNNDNTISFNHRLLQISPSELRVSFAKCRVIVYEHLDGSIHIFCKQKELKHNQIPKRQKRHKDFIEHLLQKHKILTF